MFKLKMPHSIFVQADCFLKACRVRTDPPNPYDVSVLVTNCAIACELYMKCLIHIERGQLVTKQHNLKKLFAMLSDKAKETMRTRFDALAQVPTYDFSDAPEEIRKLGTEAAALAPKDLITALRQGAEAFVEWRYIYEDDGGGKRNAFSLFPLPALLRGYIIERKPLWANFVVHMEKIGDALPTSPAR